MVCRAVALDAREVIELLKNSNRLRDGNGFILPVLKLIYRGHVTDLSLIFHR